MPDTPQPAAPANGAIPNAGANGASPPSRRDDQSSFSVSVGQVYDGPLDLLLDLIRKQDIDIYDIPIARITAQYLTYVETMKGFDVDVAAEFIYTASLLIHIKSKMLLPRDPAGPASEEDPRMELVNRLLEHERFKTAAQMLLQKQQIEENVWSNPSLKEFRDAEGAEPELAARGERRGRDGVADDRLRAAAPGVGRAPGTPEADAAYAAFACRAGLCISGDPGIDTIAGGAGPSGQCLRRGRAEEAHEFRLADGGESAGEGRLAVRK
jgi:hypothetical protein